MNSPSAFSSRDSGFDEASGFGAVEVCCFLALLSSVLLFGGAASNFLVTVVVARALWLFGAWPEGEASDSVGTRSRRVVSFILVSLAYQLPFWISLATLPIRGIDQNLLLQGFLGQVLILSSAAVISVLLPWVNMLVFGGFLAQGVTVCILTSWPLERGLFLLIGAVFLLWRFEDGSSRSLLGRKETWCLGGLAAGCWATFLGLLQSDNFSGEDLVGRVLLPWLLLNFLGSQLFSWSRGGDIELENGVDQVSVPGHRWALRSLCARRLAGSIFSSLLFLAWMPWNLSALPTFVLFYLAWDRALAISVSRVASPEVVAWWSFLELLFLVAALLVADQWLALVIGVSALSSLICGAWGRRRPGSVDSWAGAAWMGPSDLGDLLKVGAPVSLKERVSREIVIAPQLDTDLTTTAPTGFRDRLLGRLRQQDLDEDES